MGIWTFVIIACTIAVIAGLYFGGKYIYDNCYKTGEPNARRSVHSATTAMRCFTVRHR